MTIKLPLQRYISHFDMSDFETDEEGYHGKACADKAVAQLEAAYAELEAERDALRDAIHKTLDDNAHLADGENCTLMALKVALRETGEPWEGG